MTLSALKTSIEGVRLLEPTIYRDERGFFYESFNEKSFCDSVEGNFTFVQDNHSKSTRHVLRGLHYQIKQPQGKLVRVIKGSIYDVAVDLRQTSISFGEHVVVELSAQNNRQIWIPEGCAHGFLVTSDTAEVIYKTTDYYAPEYERCLRWNDPSLDIDWPLEGIMPVLSKKDAEGALFTNTELFS